MLIIFDCDGVLVDSELLGAKVFSDTLADFGFAMSAEACFERFKGWTLSACYEWLAPQMGGSLPPAFAGALKANTKARFSAELTAVDGVEALLQQLRQRGKSYCVASNGGHAKIANSLKACELAPYFSSRQRFSAEDVSSGKPDPALFLYAAESMGVPADFCWVIEDSLTGARAAKAAGMKLVFYCETGEAPEALAALEPEFVARSMSELQNMLGFSSTYNKNSTTVREVKEQKDV
ncbi:HAD family hydrolase [Agaribacterium haliotis]|uniref:HAD family hydrolase n=1 Tax=Agaribacterium haliotis TaxID=2013869 RepID=UPI000BB54F74|nr:HAD family phosphatase [Agaribacterium haliotis]